MPLAGQVLIVEVERFVVIVDLRQVRIGEYFRKHAPAATGLELQTPIAIAYPAAVPFLLVLPFLRVAHTWLGLNIVKPRVFNPFA